MKKQLSAILLFAMILSVVSCGSAEEQVYETTTSAEETTAAPTLEDKRHAISDELPDKKYGGKEFTIYVNTPRKSDFVSDEINGDVLSDAVYERNKAIEDRFEVKLNYLDDTYLELTPKVKTAVTAGDDEYQLVVNHALASDSLVIGDMHRKR